MGIWTARQIWKGLDREQRSEIALSLWTDTRTAAQDRAYALAPWMAARGLRPAYLDKLPKKRRAALLAEGGLPEETATQVLMSYHMVHQRPMLGCFLDEMGIPHEDGLIKDGSEIEEPDQERAAKAARTLQAEFPAGVVDLYLKTLTATDPETWAALADLLPDPE